MVQTQRLEQRGESDQRRRAAEAELQAASRERQGIAGRVQGIESTVSQTAEAARAARRAEAQQEAQRAEQAAQQAAQRGQAFRQQAEQLRQLSLSTAEAYAATLEPAERLEAISQLLIQDQQRLLELEQQGGTSLAAKIAVEQQRQQVLRRTAEVAGLQREEQERQLEIAREQSALEAQQKQAQEAIAESQRQHLTALQEGQWNLVEIQRAVLEGDELSRSLMEERAFIAERIAEIQRDGVSSNEEQLELLELQGRQMRVNQRLQQETERRAEAVTARFAEAGNALGTVFADAYQKAITGEQKFEDAFKDGMRSILMQLGTKYIVEGTAALLEGVGNAVMNAPHAGAKLAEGAGKLALGLSLGGIGSAIQPSAAPTSSQPAAPAGQSANRGDSQGAGTMVINFNSPVVTAGTRQQLGREIGGIVEEGRRRYGG